MVDRTLKKRKQKKLSSGAVFFSIYTLDKTHYFTWVMCVAYLYDQNFWVVWNCQVHYETCCAFSYANGKNSETCLSSVCLGKRAILNPMDLKWSLLYALIWMATYSYIWIVGSSDMFFNSFRYYMCFGSVVCIMNIYIP